MLRPSRYLFPGLVLIFLVNSAYAFDLEGTVYGFDGEPLVDARLRLLTHQRVEINSTYTDGQGAYRLRNIPAGSYTVEITKVGMQKITMDVGVGGSFYRSTVYNDFHLKEITRFESVRSSEMKALFLPEDDTIPLGAFSSYRRGLKKMAKNKTSGALKDFKRAIKRHPGFSRCHTHIGEIYVLLNQYDDAETAFQKAIELNPRDPVPLTSYGRFLISINRYDDATLHLSKAVELDPARAENYYLLGEAHYKSGSIETAEKALVQGLMIQPRQAGKARLILADIYYDQKRFDDTRDMLSGYLRDNPFAEDRDDVRERIIELNRLIQNFEDEPAE
jgi:tetratricopeptide (TPR) repeat protein